MPLYIDDRPESMAYILNDSGCKVLLIRGQEQWEGIQTVLQDLDVLVRILTLETVNKPTDDGRVCTVADWLPSEPTSGLRTADCDSNDLATIV